MIMMIIIIVLIMIVVCVVMCLDEIQHTGAGGGRRHAAWLCKDTPVKGIVNDLVVKNFLQ